MNSLKFSVCLFVLLAAIECQAQVFIDCDVEFYGGGSARAEGLFRQTPNGPRGSLNVQLTGFKFDSIRMESITSLHYLGGTALFEGPAVMTRGQGRFMKRIHGTLGGYVEDIDASNPNFPDSMILIFETKTDVRLSVSGALTSGEITVIDQ